MRNVLTVKMASLGLAGALAMAAAPLAAPAVAGPVPSATLALKTTAPDVVQDVQWRRRGGGAFVGGLAAGIIGATAFGALAPRYYGYDYGPAYGYAPAYGYYDAPYAYDGPVAAYGYAYGPAYYGDTRTRQQRLRDRADGD